MNRTFKQAGAAYTRVVDLIENSIVRAWNNQLEDRREAEALNQTSEVTA
jgi:hypothetical protein